MNVKPTQAGGRIAQGDTPWLKYRVVDGVVEVWEVKTPAIAQANIDKARERMAVCAGCDNAKSVTTEKHGMPVYAVKCKAAGRCANVSLINGRCPARKW